MKIPQRVAFGACGALLLVLPDIGPAWSRWVDIAFHALGAAYILVAIWWPKPKDEPREDSGHIASDNGC